MSTFDMSHAERLRDGQILQGVEVIRCALVCIRLH